MNNLFRCSFVYRPLKSHLFSPLQQSRQQPCQVGDHGCQEQVTARQAHPSAHILLLLLAAILLWHHNRAALAPPPDQGNGSNPDDSVVAFDFSAYLILHKSGRVHRLAGTSRAPPGMDEESQGGGACFKRDGDGLAY
jgi:hypothetical protein